jgi:hypothetical protein
VVPAAEVPAVAAAVVVEEEGARVAGEEPGAAESNSFGTWGPASPSRRRWSGARGAASSGRATRGSCCLRGERDTPVGRFAASDRSCARSGRTSRPEPRGLAPGPGGRHARASRCEFGRRRCTTGPPPFRQRCPRRERSTGWPRRSGLRPRGPRESRAARSGSSEWRPAPCKGDRECRAPPRSLDLAPLIEGHSKR